MKFFGIVCVLFMVAWPCTGGSEDWPQWRGPGRDGITRGAKVPQSWPAEMPKPVWQVAIGEGYSSPVISGNRLYIMAREPRDKEVCLCLDAANGRQIWKYAYHAPYDPHPAARSAGKGPKSTPTVDGDRVYMLGVTGVFHCFDAATGRVGWKHDFQAEYWGQKGDDGYDVWATYCGASASPLVDGDRVILPVGGAKAGAFTAFDKKTGKILWRAKGSANGVNGSLILPDRSSYSSPMIARIAGERQLVGFTGTRLLGINPGDGTLLWEYPFPASYDQTIVSPVIWRDLVIACGEAKPAAALRLQKSNGKLAATVAWRNRNLQTYMPSPVMVRNHLFTIDEGGQMGCIDLATGKTIWEKGSFGQYASMVIAGDQLLVLGEDGKLHVLDATPKAYTVRATLTVSETGGTWSHLAVVGSRLYVKDKQNLMCFDFAAP